jgi:membrane fusion protein, copper/silver efflux system
MSVSAMKLAEIQTTKVTFGSNAPEKTIQLTGKVEIDERNISQLAAHFHGRIEKLYISYTGEKVKKGQLLASVYSPELIVAQQELLQSLTYKQSNPVLYRAARNKLKNWKISDVEIDKIEQSGNIMTEMKVHSHHSGVVLKKYVNTGDHAQLGDVLFEIADLSKVWILFDAYEKDLQWITTGTNLVFSVAAIPNRIFSSTVSFIDPIIDPKSRIAKVRVEIDNSLGLLKPEMFANGTIKVKTKNESTKLLVPQSAVLWTGKRSLVYVKKPNSETPVFEFRQITISTRIDDNYLIEDGLEEGEEIVTKGTYTIDAAAQLSGKVSMMNSEGGATMSGHNHGGSATGTNKVDHNKH